MGRTSGTSKLCSGPAALEACTVKNIVQLSDSSLTLLFTNVRLSKKTIKLHLLLERIGGTEKDGVN